jgi:transposase
MPSSPHSPAKARILHQQNLLHPHPETVTDPLFGHSPFFDPQDSLQVKYEMLRRVSVDRVSVTEAAAAFGFSRPSFYQAQTAFTQYGLLGLLPHKRGPRGGHKLTAEIMAFVLRERAVSPRPTVDQLLHRVHREFGILVHRRSLQRQLAQQEKKEHSLPAQRLR